MIVKVSQRAASQKGSVAKLKEGDKLTVYDLVHGLIIPSGNDAAHALAESFGELLHKQTEAFKASQSQLTPEEHCMKFVSYMNDIAKSIGMKDTKYKAPQGSS